MLLDSLLPVGAAAVGISLLMVFIYYILSAEPGQPTEPDGPAWSHHPVLDDDLLYLTSAMVPYPEYAYFPVPPLSLQWQEVTHPVQSTTTFAGLPLHLERQEAIQPA